MEKYIISYHIESEHIRLVNILDPSSEAYTLVYLMMMVNVTNFISLDDNSMAELQNKWGIIFIKFLQGLDDIKVNIEMY